MKMCSKCSLEKDESEFVFKKKSKNLRHVWCRACHKEYKDQHYKDNKQKYVDRAGRYKKVRKTQHYDALRDYVSKFPCVDCGETDYVVLQFDHVRGVKEAGISEMVSGGWAWDKIIRELEKCDVRCANCHTRKTAKQFGWYKRFEGSLI